jgi:CubicO group peptidase (beta-lactamase class C family)
MSLRVRPLRRALLAGALLAAALPGRAAAQAPTGWDWPVARPAEAGMDAAVLAAFEADITAGKYGHVDGMLVIRHGRIVWERTWRRDYGTIYAKEAGEPSPLNASDPTGPYNYFNPWWHPWYRGGDLHSLQSVTKTITSVVIGAAVARGDFPDIDTPVLRWLDTTKVEHLDARKRRMTIRHLLTMTAGLDWNEGLPYTDPRNSAVQLEASRDWVAFTINRPMVEEPGRTFNYSSGVSALLAHVFRAATGRDIEEYAARHLFAPLGIRDWHWKRSPTGLIDTEGGLYLRARDVARIWQLFLQAGAWQGRRILTSEWVQESVAPAVAVGGGRGPAVKYGLKWWLAPYSADTTRLAWAGSGFGGQIPVAIPEHGLVVVFNGWNILPGRPALGRQVAVERVLAALRP